jgi:hypothetical protein
MNVVAVLSFKDKLVFYLRHFQCLAENSRNSSLVEGPSYTLDHLATFSRGQQLSKQSFEIFI